MLLALHSLRFLSPTRAPLGAQPFLLTLITLVLLLTLLPLEAARSETSDIGAIVIKPESVGTATDRSASVLRMSFNQAMDGELVGSADDEIRWRNDYFDKELSVRINRVRRLDTGRSVSITETTPFAFDFVEGHTVMGNVVAIRDAQIFIESDVIGTARFPTSSLTRIRRLSLPKAKILSGFQGKVLGSQSNVDEDWKLSGSTLQSHAKRVIWYESFETFPQIRFDLRLTWEEKPDFELLFFDHQPRVVISKEIPRLEVWDKKLVAVQQTSSHADVTKLWEFDDRDAELDLTIYVDTIAKSLSVFTRTGAYLGSIDIQGEKHEGLCGIGFINLARQTTIQSLLVSEWDGKLPYAYGKEKQGSEPDLVEANGLLTAMSSDRQSIQLRNASGGIETIPLDRLGSLLNIDPDVPKQVEPKPEKVAVPELVSLLLADGSQLIGRLAPSESGEFSLVIQDGSQNLQFGVEKVVSLRPTSPTETIPTTGVRLAMPGVALFGSIVDLPISKPNARLQFDSSVFSQSVGIREHANGSILFNRTNIQPQAMAWKSPIPNRPLGLVPNGLPPGESNSAISPYRTPEDLQLRSGDILDASVQTIDEQGVTIQSSLTNATFLPHHVIRSVELKNPFRGKEIDRKKMERLLTVPRMQKEFPPTHLLITTQSDYHRGKLIRLTNDFAEFEEGLTPIKIPRNIISVIVWLHDREWDDKIAPKQALDPNVFHLNVRTRSKSRFTLEPLKFENQRLYGQSQLLGEVTIPLSDIEGIEFGKNIEEMLEQTADNPWRLDLAKSPIVFDEAAAASSGMQSSNSPLVGNPAPNFELKGLDGNKWRLGDQKGKVVVLDFWASWCGPCMHGMPLVEGIVRDFKQADCVWVGVNIEESDVRARTAIERLGIEGEILLDELGGVAKEYQARAIPLTVIIDREGIVRHAFVGADGASLAGIRQALESLN
jgi:peroxiredoxin